VLLDDKSHTIIGIMPPEVELEERWLPPLTFFIPFSIEAAVTEGEDQDYGMAVVRIKPGATFAKAKAELHLISTAAGPRTIPRPTRISKSGSSLSKRVPLGG